MTDTPAFESLPPDAAEVFRPFWRQVVMLNVKWKLFTQLYGQGPGRIELLNQIASVFFSVIEEVMRHDILLHIARLLDPAQSRVRGQLMENVSLRALVARLASTSAPKTAHLEELLAEIETKWEPMKPWRDKTVAHTDLRTIIDRQQLAVDPTGKPEPLPAVQGERIEEIVRLITEFLGAAELAGACQQK